MSYATAYVTTLPETGVARTLAKYPNPGTYDARAIARRAVSERAIKEPGRYVVVQPVCEHANLVVVEVRAATAPLEVVMP